jgi:predicted peroxiredoxin
MTHYLFIESQDPLEDRGAQDYLGFALGLARQREPVTVYFVENGANAVRKGAALSVREALREVGASLRVDSFALKERGILPERIAQGVEIGDVHQMVDLLADPQTKAIWH